MSGTLHIVCPHCERINRIPATRLDEAPSCGHCHQRLFTGHPIDLTGANFKRYIERNDIPVVVDFWAPWCGPCQMMAPQYAAAAGELEPKVRLAKLNTEAEPEIRHNPLGARARSKYGCSAMMLSRRPCPEWRIQDPRLLLTLPKRRLARRRGATSVASSGRVSAEF